jgi:hypothetical protein
MTLDECNFVCDALFIGNPAEIANCKKFCVFKPTGIAGTDCKDSDCIDKTGPGGAKCCFAAANCPGSGAVCVNNECKETVCSNNVDDDGDNRTDCADSDCLNKLCKTSFGGMGFCFQGNCTQKPKAEAAPVEVKRPLQITSYGDILKIINTCKVRKGTGNSCRDICQAGEKGFPTKIQNNTIMRCTCC